MATTPSFSDYLKSNTINEDMYKEYSPDEQSALYNGYSQWAKDPTALTNAVASGYAAQGNLDWSPDNSSFWSTKGNLGGLASLGQVGVSAIGTLDAMKTAKTQRALLNQQLSNNTEKMDAWRAGKANVTNAFSGGLAASGV